MWMLKGIALNLGVAKETWKVNSDCLNTFGCSLPRWTQLLFCLQAKRKSLNFPQSGCSTAHSKHGKQEVHLTPVVVVTCTFHHTEEAINFLKWPKKNPSNSEGYCISAMRISPQGLLETGFPCFLNVKRGVGCNSQSARGQVSWLCKARRHGTSSWREKLQEKARISGKRRLLENLGCTSHQGIVKKLKQLICFLSSRQFYKCNCGKYTPPYFHCWRCCKNQSKSTYMCVIKQQTVKQTDKQKQKAKHLLHTLTQPSRNHAVTYHRVLQYTPLLCEQSSHFTTCASTHSLSISSDTLLLSKQKEKESVLGLSTTTQNTLFTRSSTSQSYVRAATHRL